MTLEVGVFAAATALAGKLDPVSSGSHQIALNIAALAFMVPLGLSSAGAVRVGHAIGARDESRAVLAGWTALATGAVIMAIIGLVLFLWPVALISAFTTDQRVIDIGVRLLAIAAAFQLFDGTQAVVTGVLRGIGETRMPMVINVVGHWLFGLPVGYALCFWYAWGVLWSVDRLVDWIDLHCTRPDRRVVESAHNTMLNDAHCHFFSSSFFSTLSRQRGRGDSVQQLCGELQWDDPGTPESLADRWVRELDANGVGRAALIASVPGDEASVAAAIASQPTRFVGFFMLDPSASDAAERTRRAIGELGLRGLCLFPAMHHVPLSDSRVQEVVEIAAGHPGTAVFVHCGVLSVGVRRKLGLPSQFDLRLGDPLGVARLALAYPNLPFIIPHFGAGMFREALDGG